MRTSALTVHGVEPGARMAPRRDAASRLVAVVSGKGRLEVGGESFVCERGDIVAVPIWTPHAFQADASTRLLEVSDEPVQQLLGFFRQDSLG
jgi:gentisate 1,2-dioxygenase